MTTPVQVPTVLHHYRYKKIMITFCITAAADSSLASWSATKKQTRNIQVVSLLRHGGVIRHHKNHWPKLRA